MKNLSKPKVSLRDSFGNIKQQIGEEEHHSLDENFITYQFGANPHQNTFIPNFEDSDF